MCQNKISQLCSAYDQAQKATRDSFQREKREQSLKITHETRNEIETLVSVLMRRIDGEFPTNQLSGTNGTYEVMTINAAHALVYFNSWFNMRGGWT